jgi:hypothetical protein
MPIYSLAGMVNNGFKAAEPGLACSLHLDKPTKDSI